ncbi:MAG TPA: GNAT family N-acetyltransferase [Bryobacteraceae bacterium]|jgi:ribosomal-protein-alanine N-acetyltransferase
MSRDQEIAFDNIAGPTFDTERLCIRTLQPGDEDFLVLLHTDPEVMEHIDSGALSQNDAMKWAQAQVKMAPYGLHLRKSIVELRDSRVKVGWIELGKFRGVFDPSESRMSDDVNFGYQLDRTHWGQRFIAEAAMPVLAYAFHRLKLDRVVAFARPENVRSERVLERLGFRRHPTRPYKDEVGQNCRLYALPRGDWQY